MTVFERLRAWLGGLFGGGASDADGEGDDPASSDDPSPRVVHRDDRPLETPSTMDRTDPPAPESRSGTRVDIPDAETDGPARGGRDQPTAEADTVSIPDAEPASPTGAESAASDGADPAVDERTEPTPAPTPDTADGTQEDAADGAFACSVCGTTVDDPSTPCPLCRSTDVVPVADAAEADEPLTRGGRTAVSTTDDDEAVNRLRDVRDDE